MNDGLKMVCVSAPWYAGVQHCEFYGYGPKKGEIVTIVSGFVFRNSFYFQFVEYPDLEPMHFYAFRHDFFERMVSDEVLYRDLNEIFQIK